ncbi:MAG: CDP-alcohol phosphatidyltransferase family protein [Muribaculaceae bacterium]|nr:CDP-alcohol phosphatidyltransferase family protein [Muribaculaceae bacterium]
MENNKENSVRIQTSMLNELEKKALVWLANRQPKWVTSDLLTYIGTFGSIIIATGYILSSINIHFLWLSSLGFIINWYGDSLDGTLARVRNHKRPIYGYYLDHTIDVINETIMFVGIGLSPLMNLELALLLLVVYLMMTVNVSINAHLKDEFKLTYAKLGPTEFRIICIIINTLIATIPFLQTVAMQFNLFGKEITFHSLDFAGVVILVVLFVMHITTITADAKGYAKIDPPHKD